MRPLKAVVYRTVTGRSIDLTKLLAAERRCLLAVLGKYRKDPEWSEFGSWWMRYVAKCGIGDASPVYRICDDLEARLGIAQGKVASPDYRDYLAALIQERFGSRYRFCMETGVDQGQLSRVFAGRSDLSLHSLQKLLQALRARLVVQPEEAVKANASPDEAKRALASVAR